MAWSWGLILAVVGLKFVLGQLSIDTVTIQGNDTVAVNTGQTHYWTVVLSITSSETAAYLCNYNLSLQVNATSYMINTSTTESCAPTSTISFQVTIPFNTLVSDTAYAFYASSVRCGSSNDAFTDCTNLTSGLDVSSALSSYFYAFYYSPYAIFSDGQQYFSDDSDSTYPIYGAIWTTFTANYVDSDWMCRLLYNVYTFSSSGSLVIAGTFYDDIVCSLGQYGHMTYITIPAYTLYSGDLYFWNTSVGLCGAPDNNYTNCSQWTNIGSWVISQGFLTSGNYYTLSPGLNPSLSPATVSTFSPQALGTIIPLQLTSKNNQSNPGITMGVLIALVAGFSMCVFGISRCMREPDEIELRTSEFKDSEEGKEIEAPEPEVAQPGNPTQTEVTVATVS